eukprot:3766174-Pyramimonas_sp.AAC.1
MGPFIGGGDIAVAPGFAHGGPVAAAPHHAGSSTSFGHPRAWHDKEASEILSTTYSALGKGRYALKAPKPQDVP